MYPPLIQTDQIHCYSEEGRQINCQGAGQDASNPGKMINAAPSRFKILDQVIEDRFTGAIWSRDANPAQYPLTWIEARQFVADMRKQSSHGYNDWRLPSRDLLFSLISHQKINPALPEGNPFQNVFPGYYWTAETTRRLPNQAWYIHLGGGRIHKGMQHGSYMVWPVSYRNFRKAADSVLRQERFKTADLWVQDTRTGLTWAKDANLIGSQLTWQEAIEAVEQLNREDWGKRHDWRLPNIRELESLIDLEHHSPALLEKHPFANVQDTYWSSTTSVYEPRYAWALYTEDGAVGVGFKINRQFYLWPVSG